MRRVLPEHFDVTPYNIDAAMRYWAVFRELDSIWRPGLDMLEVGSGSGGATEFLDHPLTGVDTAFGRTRELASRLLEAVPAPATELPFPTAAFDVVLCLEMLEHLPRDERHAAVAEMMRVLRPGGRLVLTFPVGPTAEQLDCWLNDCYRRKRGRDHPWVIEHIERGLPSERDVQSLVEGEFVGATVTVRKQGWAPIWKFQHALFSIEVGYPWTRAIGIHSCAGARLFFLLTRRLNLGSCYRVLITATK